MKKEVLAIPKTQNKSGRMIVKPAVLTLTLNGDNEGELKSGVEEWHSGVALRNGVDEWLCIEKEPIEPNIRRKATPERLLNFRPRRFQLAQYA